MDISALSSTAAAGGSNASKAGARLSEDFNDFLILLTTQLQQQDPLDPLDSNQFTQQLVQFTGVEQSIATNKNLESIIGLLSGKSLTNLVGLIGNTVTADSSEARLSGGSATWRYSLDTAADQTQISILDSTGTTVLRTGGATGAGAHEFVWDGRDQAGRALPDGIYTINIAANAGSAGVATSTSFKGTVDGVETFDGEEVLIVDGIRVPLPKILSVVTPPEPVPLG